MRRFPYLGHVSSPPPEDDVTVLRPEGPVWCEEEKISEHDLPRQHGEGERADLEVSSRVEVRGLKDSVGNIGCDGSHQAGVVEGDVGHPEHGEHQTAQEQEEVSGGIYRREEVHLVNTPGDFLIVEHTPFQIEFLLDWDGYIEKFLQCEVLHEK